MNQLKRVPIKMIRDYMKKDYIKDSCCYICGSSDSLELHHLYSLSDLFNSWCAKNRIRELQDADTVLVIRQQFYDEHAAELSAENLITLCQPHHRQLHDIYGLTYANSLVPRIRNWLQLQKEKNGR
jgi:5-methylcytosine-specific restriction endonuclease McrA